MSQLLGDDDSTGDEEQYLTTKRTTTRATTLRSYDENRGPSPIEDKYPPRHYGTSEKHADSSDRSSGRGSPDGVGLHRHSSGHSSPDRLDRDRDRDRRLERLGITTEDSTKIARSYKGSDDRYSEHSEERIGKSRLSDFETRERTPERERSRKSSNLSDKYRSSNYGKNDDSSDEDKYESTGRDRSVK
eukprot:gene24088-10184_t